MSLRDLKHSCLVAVSLLFASVACNAALQVEIGQNFTASTFNVDSYSLPADANGAVGPNYYVEFINGRFAVFNKTNGVRVQSIEPFGWWQTLGISMGIGMDVSDPRIVYDRASGRWFVAEIDFNAFTYASNRFLIAVSATSDPTGTWKAVSFQADTNGNFADYPTLGLDGNGLYLAANMFTPGASNYLGVLLESIPKADLLLSSPSVARRTSFGIMTESQRGFTLEPAINFGSTSAVPVIAVETAGLDFQPHTILKSYFLTNTATTNAGLSANIDITVPPWTVPINPPQPNGLSTLDDGDSRIGASVYQVGNTLYAVHGTEVNGRAAIQWYRINATDSTLIEAGTIADPDLNFFYPSLAANSNGCVVICFNGCSSNQFVSCYGAVGETVNGQLQFAQPILLKAGTANYTPSQPRWGDYSTTTVDPTNENSFWTIQEVCSAQNVWSTQVTELRLSQTPQLLASLTGNQLNLRWPTNAAGFVLEFKTDLGSGGSWASAPESVSVAGDMNVVSVSVGSAQKYYRLKK